MPTISFHTQKVPGGAHDWQVVDDRKEKEL
jgi:hypothetical protein